MNSHKQQAYIDQLLRQALQPYAQVKAPPDMWPQVEQGVQNPPPPRWRRFFSWLYGLHTLGFSTMPNHLPYRLEPHKKCAPPPFIGVIAKQTLDLRLAS